MKLKIHIAARGAHEANPLSPPTSYDIRVCEQGHIYDGVGIDAKL